MSLRILLISLLIPTLNASYCGKSAIPFTFQVLKSGFPVLGCARPKCFGWTANGTRAADSAQFYRVAGKDDGFLRISEQFVKAPSSNPNFVPQVAICRDDYKSDKCEEGQWVGGLSPQSDPFTDKIKMRCCSYQTLISSEDRGMAVVKQGQVVVGGEVMDNGRLVAFDYISNLSKAVTPNGTIIYTAHVMRMPCFDETVTQEETPKPENTIVENAAAVNSQASPTPQNAKIQQEIAPQQVNQQAFAAPTQNVPSYPQQQQQQPAVGQTNYGQFTQQGYGVAQNGQYQGYPQYAQQQQYQGSQYPQQQQQQPQQQQQQQYYQDPLAAMFQQQQQVLQQQQQPQPQQMGFVPMPPFPQQINMFPQQPLAGGVAAQQVQLPVTSTLPPVTLPKLEDLPKLQIPSVEDVEQVIPPVQRAILTSVAKFFGVL